MPIVFVHGVNNRKEDAGFAEDVARKKEFLKTLLATPLGLDPARVKITFPYWGGDGVKFLWNQVSLPGTVTKPWRLVRRTERLTSG